jgi:hypothetical protein
MTAEDQYRRCAMEARFQSLRETDPADRRQLMLRARRYEELAVRAKRTVEARKSLARKSA